VSPAEISANLLRRRLAAACRGAYRMTVRSRSNLLLGLAAALLCGGTNAPQAQPTPQAAEWAAGAALDAELPVDPAVRHGRLENGLRYFIRENAEPRN